MGIFELMRVTDELAEMIVRRALLAELGRKPPAPVACIPCKKTAFARPGWPARPIEEVRRVVFTGRSPRGGAPGKSNGVRSDGASIKQFAMRQFSPSAVAGSKTIGATASARRMPGAPTVFDGLQCGESDRPPTLEL